MSLYRKYRPQKFVDVIGEDHVRDTLLSAISEDKIGHSYLFAGPRGVGKTTVARLLAKAVNCQKRSELDKEKNGEPCGECEFCKGIVAGKNLDIVEIDAASNRGIDEIRELREKIKFSPSSGKYKVFIIDEVHMLTLPAFNALLKTLEEPPAHAIFILATTEAHKVPATILSRVQRFDFHRISKSDIISNLKLIAKSEKLEVDDEALEVIAVAAEGSHRDSISLLEQVCSLSKKITLSDVRSILGLAKSEEIVAVIEQIATGDSKAAIKTVNGLVSEGVDSQQINKEITEVLRQLLLVSISGGEIDFEVTEERMAKLSSLAKQFSAEAVNQILEIFINASQLLKETSIRSLPVEMAIVEACDLKNQKSKIKDQPVSPPASRGGNDNVKFKIEKPVVPEKIIKKEKSEAEEVEENPTKNLDLESWKKILEKIKAENHSLNALLRDAKPEGISDDLLLISVKFKFHHDKISEAANCQVIEKAAEEILGQKIRVKCQIGDKKHDTRDLRSDPTGKSQTKNYQENDLEKAAEEIFEVE